MNMNKYSKLWRKLNDEQLIKANKLLKSKVFLATVKKFRKEFLKSGFPGTGFASVAEKERWLNTINSNAQEKFIIRINRITYSILIQENYSDKWENFIKHFIFFNKSAKPPLRNCNYTVVFDKKKDLWNFQISGFNAIPSVTELQVIKHELTNLFEQREGTYLKRNDFIAKEAEFYNTLSIKKLKIHLETMFGIEVTRENLYKIRNRKRNGQKDIKIHKKH